MRTRIVLSVFLFAALFAVPFRGASAEEKEVKAADVPKAVTDAVAKQYPGGKVTRWESDTKKDKTIYEAKVEITTKGADKKETVRHVDVALAADGTFLEEEENIDAAALPAAVKKAIADGKFAKAKVAGIEKSASGAKLETVKYEVKFELDGKTYEVTYDAKGTVLEEEGPEEGEGGEMK